TTVPNDVEPGAYHNVVVIGQPSCEEGDDCTPPPCPENLGSAASDFPGHLANDVACDDTPGLAVDKLESATEIPDGTPEDEVLYVDQTAYRRGMTATYKFVLRNLSQYVPLTNVAVDDHLVYGTSPTDPASDILTQDDLKNCRDLDGNVFQVEAGHFTVPVIAAGATEVVYCDLYIPTAQEGLTDISNDIFNRFAATGSSAEGPVSAETDNVVIDIVDTTYNPVLSKTVKNVEGVYVSNAEFPPGPFTADFKWVVINVSQAPIDMTMYEYFETMSPANVANIADLACDSGKRLTNDADNGSDAEAAWSSPVSTTFASNMSGTGGPITREAWKASLGVVPPGEGFEFHCVIDLTNPAPKSLTNTVRLLGEPVQVESAVGRSFRGFVSPYLRQVAAPVTATIDFQDQASVYNPAADMAIVKDVKPAEVAVGQSTPAPTVTYTLTVGNNGPLAALNAKVVDVLPAQLQSISIVDDGAYSCAVAGQTITCTRATPHPAGETVTITYTAKVVVDLTDIPETITNTATVSSDTPDTDLTNNTDTATVSPGQVFAPIDVRIVKSVNVPEIIHGLTFVYTLVVTNDGPEDADGVTVTDAIPAGYTIQSVDRGTFTLCGVSGQTVTCSKALMTVGESATIRITVQAPSTGLVNGTFVLNTGVVSTTDEETDLSNNSSSVRTPVKVVSLLPPTGTDLIVPVKVGVGLGLGGLLLVLVGRRRPARAA
ncbi:MAG TPA: DUF11 domain-containing protein, partial [Acidimicrobiales bacterium]